MSDVEGRDDDLGYVGYPVGFKVGSKIGPIFFGFASNKHAENIRRALMSTVLTTTTDRSWRWLGLG